MIFSFWGLIMMNGDRLSFSKLESLESRRLFAAGDVDTTFGTNGLVQKVFAHGTVVINAVEPVANDKFFVAGGVPTKSHPHSTVSEAICFSVNPDGSLDSTFGVNGTATGNFIVHQTLRTLQFFPAARSLDDLYEVNNKANEYHLLARFNADGSVDTTFGTNGFVTLKVDKLDNQGNFDLDVQSDGKMVVEFDNHVLRYNTDGTPDASFGPGGAVTPILPIGSLSESVARAQQRQNPDWRGESRGTDGG